MSATEEKLRNLDVRVTSIDIGVKELYAIILEQAITNSKLHVALCRGRLQEAENVMEANLKRLEVIRSNLPRR